MPPAASEDARVDLLVLGGGPAGSATALAARDAGLEVVLVDAARAPVRKVCGEFLSEPGFDEWRRLTGAPAAPHPRITGVVFRRGTAAEFSVPIPLDPPAHGVRRETLDETLLDAAGRAGIRVHRGFRGESIVRDAAGWSVALVSPQEGRSTSTRVRARQVVRATGRVAMAGGGGWFGVRGPGGRVDDESRLEMTLLPDGGYYGRCAVDGGVGMAGLSRSASAPWGAEAPDGGRVIDFGTPRFLPGFQPPDPTGLPLVGDALAAWPPLVGDGMTVALLSGGQLGRLIARHGVCDTDVWRREWEEMFGARLERALRWHRWITSPRWGGAVFAAMTALPAVAAATARRLRGA